MEFCRVAQTVCLLLPADTHRVSGYQACRLVRPARLSRIGLMDDGSMEPSFNPAIVSLRLLPFRNLLLTLFWLNLTCLGSSLPEPGSLTKSAWVRNFLEAAAPLLTDLTALAAPFAARAARETWMAVAAPAGMPGKAVATRSQGLRRRPLPRPDIVRL